MPSNGHHSPGTHANGHAAAHGLRREAIVQALLLDVVQGQLRAGQHLVTQELANRFRVSHTPVREALIALGGMGVIDLLPNRGAIVRRMTRKDVLEVCQVRRALECEAVRLACGRIDRRELTRLATQLRRLLNVPRKLARQFVERARQLDSQLHDLVAASCGNAFLAHELNRLKLLFRAFRDVSYVMHTRENDFPRLAEEAREHLAVVEALLAGHRTEAVRAMSRHIRSGVKYWSRALPDDAAAAAPRTRLPSIAAP